MKKTDSALKTFIIILFLLSVSMPSLAQEQVESATFTRAELLEDFEMLWEGMQSHPKLHEFTSEATYASLRKSINAKLQDGMTADDFLRVAHPLIVNIGCNHSILWGDFSKPKTGNTIPLAITFQKEGAFVLSTFPAEQIPVGSRIASINGLSINEIEKVLFNYFPADGKKNIGIKRSRTGLLLSDIYPKLLGESEEYLISYTTPSSDVAVSKTLKAFDKKSIWDGVMADLQQSPYSVEYKPEINAAIIKIKTFWFNGDTEKFTAFLAETFGKIKEDNIEHLILDLRANGGGDPNLAALLFSYITHKPEVYFAIPSGYENLAEPVQLAENHFSKNIYTLIDNGGFSTAGHIVALLKYHKIGTLIGSELGCTYTCNDNSISVVLKNTGNIARVARNVFAVAVEGMKADRGVLPDHPVAFSVDDLINGVDSEMEYARKLISTK
jgi:hypothetical protein